VIAIGRPGESIPPLGAARMYIEDADWQSTVSSLMEKATAVVILLFTHNADTQAPPPPGLRWELEEAFSLLSPHQLLLVMPTAALKMMGVWRQSILGLRKRKASAIASYRSIAIQAILPCKLPETEGNVEYIAFKKDWNPYTLRSRKRKANLAAISDALGPFFEGFGQKPQSTSSLVLNFKYNLLYRVLYIFLAVCTVIVLFLWLFEWIDAALRR
jgi:hypothetical protein